MALATYLDHSKRTTPTISPRAAASSQSTPDYHMFLNDMETDGRTGRFEIVTSTGQLHQLGSRAIVLLLTPVIAADPTKMGTRGQDPFELLGKKLSSHHSRIRHVPYIASVGLTETHYAFAREADAIFYITLKEAEIKMESIQLYLSQSGHRLKGERRSRPIVVHLRFQKHPGGRADSPRDEVSDSIYPSEADFDDAVKKLVDLI